jgi:hypothetical protein
VAARNDYQLLWFAGAAIGLGGEVGQREHVIRREIIMNGVAEMSWMLAAGSYTGASSTERTLYRFSHLGARVFPVLMNQS